MKYPGVRPLPKAIIYTYPDGYRRRGTIGKRVVGRSTSKSKSADYVMVVEEIFWEGEREPTIRFGYYLKNRGAKRWHWGSQTTFHFRKTDVETILRKAISDGFLSP